MLGLPPQIQKLKKVAAPDVKTPAQIQKLKKVAAPDAMTPVEPEMWSLRYYDWVRIRTGILGLGKMMMIVPMRIEGTGPTDAGP